MKVRTMVAAGFFAMVATTGVCAKDSAPNEDASAEKKSAQLFASPVCGSPFRVLRPFGERETRRGKSNHVGVDIRVVLPEDCKTSKENHPECDRGILGFSVCAVADGEVVEAKYNRARGNTVIIKHDDHLSTVYAHAHKLLVKEGQKVSKGQIIMLAGSTGVSTGIHLHLEVRKDGIAVDPENYMSLDGTAYDSREDLKEVK